MKDLKKIRSLLFFIIFMIMVVFVTAAEVKADILYVPDNDFYQKHYTECETAGCKYIACGRGGKLIIYESPISGRKMGSVENGTAVYIFCIYTDKKNITWGFCDDEIRGWIPMDYLCTVSEYTEYEREVNEEYDSTEDTENILSDNEGEPSLQTGKLVYTAAMIIPDGSRERNAAMLVILSMISSVAVTVLFILRVRIKKSREDEAGKI